MPRLFLLAVGLVAGFSPPSVAAPPQDVEFFEKKVRPVLAGHCYSCHGPKKQMAGLRLDTAEGVRKGTDEGPVVAAGDPAGGKLLKAIRREGDFPMPPKNPLPAEAVAALSEWVKIGAPFPEAEQAIKPGAAKGHWAFQPVRDPSPPAVKEASRAQNPIDLFVLAKLEAKGLTLSPSVDKRTLLRR